MLLVLEGSLADFAEAVDKDSSDCLTLAAESPQPTRVQDLHRSL
jgi:hypothetical protein